MQTEFKIFIVGVDKQLFHEVSRIILELYLETCTLAQTSMRFLWISNSFYSTAKTRQKCISSISVTFLEKVIFTGILMPTFKAPITTAADDIHKYFFIVFRENKI